MDQWQRSLFEHGFFGRNSVSDTTCICCVIRSVIRSITCDFSMTILRTAKQHVWDLHPHPSKLIFPKLFHKLQYIWSCFPIFDRYTYIPRLICWFIYIYPYPTRPTWLFVGRIPIISHIYIWYVSIIWLLNLSYTYSLSPLISHNESILDRDIPYYPQMKCSHPWIFISDLDLSSFSRLLAALVFFGAVAALVISVYKTYKPSRSLVRPWVESLKMT